MRMQELRQKEVINTANCKSLGFPTDLEFHPKTGQLTGLILPGPARFCGCFWRDSEYLIPWNRICQIGDDIILVDIQENQCLRKL